MYGAHAAVNHLDVIRGATIYRVFLLSSAASGNVCVGSTDHEGRCHRVGVRLGVLAVGAAADQTGASTMPNALAKTLMFASSYAPLLVIFWLLDSFDSTVLGLACVAVAIVGCVGLSAVMVVASRIGSVSTTLSDVRPRDTDALSYVVTYLVPFVGASADTARERLAYLLLFAVLAVLYVRASLFYINPLLNLVGYHLHEGTRSGRMVIVVSKRRLAGAQVDLMVREISRDVLLEAR